MTRPQPAKLGPFTGGMNTYSDRSAIAENELVDCLNMELDIDGSLVCRPVIRNHPVGHGGAGWTKRLKIIGQGVWENGQSLFGSNAQGLWRLESSTGPWTKITSAGNTEFRAAVQCGKVVAFIPASTGLGGYWSPSTGWIADSNMPAGNAGVYFKLRLWVVPGPQPPILEESRLRYTNPIIVPISGSAKPAWPGENNIDVSQGDGQALIDIVVYLDQLMLFKTDSTYVLAYETLIEQGILRCINTKIGATFRVCVATYEDSVYVFHQGRVYEIKNYDFVHINAKVPFAFDLTEPVGNPRENNIFICVVEDRLVVRYFNKVYLYSLLTGTWSRWTSVNETLQNFGYMRPFPTDAVRNAPIRYYAGSVLRDETMIFEWVEDRAVDIFETVNGTTRLEIECSVLTKNYDFDDPFDFKKLGWWGVDVISKGEVTGIARPVIIDWRRTWGSLRHIPWQDLNTWEDLTNFPYFEETEVGDTSELMRKFVKFKKSMRFRQINFYVKIPSDGSLIDGPSRLFYIIPWVGQKQLVAKQVS